MGDIAHKDDSGLPSMAYDILRPSNSSDAIYTKENFPFVFSHTGLVIYLHFFYI
jgi:hypothetical protein